MPFSISDECVRRIRKIIDWTQAEPCSGGILQLNRPTHTNHCLRSSLHSRRFEASCALSKAIWQSEFRPLRMRGSRYTRRGKISVSTEELTRQWQIKVRVMRENAFKVRTHVP